MKKALKLVSVLVIGLMAGLPGLEGLVCAPAYCMQDTACPMGMPGMSADCSMPGQMAMIDCCQSGCRHASPSTALQSARPIELKVWNVETGVASVLAVPASTNLVAALLPRAIISAASPPRFILFQVFRI
jgi:hypothetical protein